MIVFVVLVVGSFIGATLDAALGFKRSPSFVAGVIHRLWLMGFGALVWGLMR